MIWWPPPLRNESSSNVHCSAPGSSEKTSRGSVNTASRTSRSPFPIRPRRYALIVSAANTSAATRPAVRSGVTGAPSSRGGLSHRRRGPPLGARRDHVGDDAVAVALDDAQRRLDQVLGEQRRLQPERRELRVHRVVVVLLELEARVLEVVDRDRDPHLRAGLLDLLGQLGDGERLGELVEHAVLAGAGWVVGGQLDALAR